jgi:hypothetical protein
VAARRAGADRGQPADFDLGIVQPAPWQVFRVGDPVPFRVSAGSAASTAISAAPSSRSRRLPWADLLRRVFADDVLQCPCGGHRSAIAVVTDPALASTLLTALGVPSDPATALRFRSLASWLPTNPPREARL